WLRLYDRQAAQGIAGPFVEQMLQRLSDLEEQAETLGEKYSGWALQSARAKVGSEIALIERFLDEVDEHKAIAADQPQTAAAEAETPRNRPASQRNGAARRRRERMERAQQSRSNAGARDPIAQRLEHEL